MKSALVHSLIVIIILLLLLVAWGTSAPATSPIQAQGGQLDLRGVDMEQHAPIKIAGEVEFYWEQLLTPEDFAQGAARPSGLIKIPASWNGYQVDGVPLNGDGYATYRFTILLDSPLHLALKIPVFETAYRLYVDDELISTRGLVGKTPQASRAQWLPNVVSFSPKTSQAQVILQVSNFHHKKGGIEEAMWLGAEALVLQAEASKLSSELFWLGSLCIMGIYHVGLFAFRSKDKSLLYFGLCCLLMGLRIMVSGEHHLVKYWPDIPWELLIKLNYLSLGLTPPAFALYMQTFFQVSGRPWRIFQFLNNLFVGLVILTPARIFTHAMTPYQLFMLVWGVYMVYALALAFKHKRQDAGIFGTGLLVLSLPIINDLLYNNGLIQTAYIGPVGIFLFTFIQSLILARRFSQAFTQAETLSIDLRRQADELARSNVELQQFAYVASHDLQEPLRMVTSYLQLLKRRYSGRLDADADEFIGFAVEGAERMRELVKGLLDYTQVDAYGRPFEPSDCQRILEQTLSNLKWAIQESGTHVSCTSPLPQLEADPVQLEQLFQNLIGNAIKFRSQQPPEIHISAQLQDGAWLFAVRDNGIGIDPQYAERIFDIFQRLHTRDEYPGTGIGLAVCKHIVERHGGRIWVESQLGQGATFYFTLGEHTL